jgi:hypothetical protein
MKRLQHGLLITLFSVFSLQCQAQVLPEAAIVLRIPLVEKPTSRPMTVAFEPNYSRYIVADGGFTAMADESGNIASKSQVHVYDEQGHFIHSARPGLSNRSVYYNPNQHRLESVTYNASSDIGFAPNTGVYAFNMDKEGRLSDDVEMIAQPNPAFGDAATFPTYDPGKNVYYAKQERSNRVLIVKLDSDKPVGEIKLDLKAANVQTDDISDHWVAFTGVPGEELALLDVDHKAVLIFNLAGKFVAKCQLPTTLKLRANNHYNGHGYTNGMFFVYNEPEGEFGTYYGLRILNEAQ